MAEPASLRRPDACTLPCADGAPTSAAIATAIGGTMVIPISAAHSVSNDTTNACSVATSIAFAVTVPDAAAYSTSHINTHSSTDVKADGASISSPDEQPNECSKCQSFVRTFQGAFSSAHSVAEPASLRRPDASPNHTSILDAVTAANRIANA